MSEETKPAEDLDIDMTEAPSADARGERAAVAPNVPVLTANAAVGVPAAGRPAPAFTPAQGVPSVAMAEAQELLAFFEREAKALGSDAAAAPLYHEMGLLWEEHLKSQRNAAVCYQNAYKLNPRYVPNLQSARRLFGEVGNWQMVAQLLDAEIAGTESTPEKLGLMQEKAVVLEEHLGKPEDALAQLHSALKLAPDDVTLLTQLEALYTTRSDFQGLRDVQVKLSEVVQDPALKAYYLASAGQLALDRLKAIPDARALFRRGFAVRPEDPVLASEVKRAAEIEEKSDELLTALEAEAEAAQGVQASPIYYRIARVLERQTRHEEALAALLSGRTSAPEDPLILNELARVFEGMSRWEELADVLQVRLGVIKDQAELIAINLRLGALYEERLSREDDAIARYRAVISVSPSNTAAVASLGKLYSRRQNWLGLLETYEAEIAAAEDPKQKVTRLYKAAELLETRLARDEPAIAKYNEILTLQPGYLPAQKALSRIYERTERYEELVQMYEQDLASTKDRDQTIAILSRVALLCEEKLNDLKRAVAALRRILVVAHDHLPTIRNLARVCERARLWDELIGANELEAALAGDSRQVISLLHRNAEIQEEQLKNKDAAIETYKKVLALSASYLPGLKALGRLYAQTGRWADLVDMYRQEAEIATSTEHAAGLLYKTGELYEEKLARQDDAIAAFQEVLTLSPNHFPALRALSRIYRSQKSWESLVEVLRAEAAARTDPAEKAHALFQVAALWEDELQRVDMAIESYQEVLRLAPAHIPSLRALERLFITRDDAPALADIYQREIDTATDDATRVAGSLKLARLFTERLNDAARAATTYEAILALDPRSISAMKSLERLRAGDRAGRAEMRTRLAHRVTDPRAAVALHLASAQDRDRAGLPEGSVEELRRAASLAPDDHRTLSAVERSYRRTGDYTSMAESIEKRLAGLAPGEMKNALHMRLGELSERQLNRPDKALASYKAVLEQNASYLPALRGARRVLQRGQPHPDVYRLMLAEGRACRDPRDAIEALIEAGKYAQEKLSDNDLAAKAWQAALEKDPLEPRATRLLEDLLAASGGSAELAQLHLRRAATKAASRDQAGAATEFFSAARVFAEKLRDGTQALAALDQALVNAPTHIQALQLRGDLCLAANRHAEAAQLYSRRVEQGGEPRELAALHHRLGVLFQEHLNDPGRATAHLQTALAVDPLNLDALERLGVIFWASRNWSGAADAYRRLVEGEAEPRKQAKHLVSFARIAEEGFQDPATAATQLKRALDLLPGSNEIIDLLAGLYDRLGDLPQLVVLLEQQAIAAGGSDKARASGLRLKAGELHLKLSDQTRAVQSFRFAVELTPDSIPARVALAEALTRDGNAVAAAIEEHRQLLRLDPFRLDSYHVLFKLYSGTRQNDRAVCVGHVLSFFKALTELEQATFSEARGRAPLETAEVLSDQDMDAVLLHPAARGPIADVVRVIGDQLHKIFEPQLEAQGLGRADRVKPDHAVYKIVKSTAAVFGVEKFDVFQGKRGAQISLENTDPATLVFGPDLVKRYNAREQRFLFARGAFGLRNKVALAMRLEPTQLADLVGNSIRVVLPDFNRLGRIDPDGSKRLRKAMSGRAVKALEGLSQEITSAKVYDVAAYLAGYGLSADRAGLLLCGDLGNALQLMFREDPSVSGQKLDSTDLILSATRKRRDMAELLMFILSEDHFRLRSRLKLGVA